MNCAISGSAELSEKISHTNENTVEDNSANSCFNNDYDDNYSITFANKELNSTSEDYGLHQLIDNKLPETPTNSDSQNFNKSENDENEDERLHDTILSGCSADRPLLNALNGTLNGVKTDWQSIYIASFLAFCCAVQYGLYVSSMWPFLEIIDKTATERFFGYIVSAYALGQIIASPLIGFLSNRCQRSSPLLYTCLVLMLIGNTFYLTVESVEPIHYRKYMILMARFITGCGSSIICIFKAYVSTASVSEDRSRAIAFVTGGIALGTMMGPSFQLIFTSFSYPGVPLILCNLSMYTAPALMACIMLLINAITIHFFFKEHYIGVVNHKTKKLKKENLKQTTPSTLPAIIITSGSVKNVSSGLLESEMKSKFILPKYDRWAVAVCHFTRFTQMFAKVNMDTIGASLAEVFFAWNATQVINTLSISQAIMSLMAFLIYLSFIIFRLDKIINFRLSCIVSLILLIVFHVLTFSYPFLPSRIKTFNHTNEIDVSEVGEHSLGCDINKFLWCNWVRAPNATFFFVTYVICVGVAFSNLNISMNTLFSKIIGPRKQGTQQGILQMSGSIARMIGPVLVSWVYDISGPPMVWLMELTVVSLNLFFWFILYKRMVPLQFNENQQ